jgi:phosphohistidine swiveling domain-containing protein
MLMCRELTTPGVVQANGAKSRLEEGARVTVDGTNGWGRPRT